MCLPEEILESIRRHAREAYREEACGAIYGRCTHKSKEALRAEPLPNAREGDRRRRFLITSTDYRRAEARAAEHGMDLLGFYHSHPDHPAYPSSYDLEHAFPSFSYVIVSVREGEPGDVRSFVLTEDRSAFGEEELETT